MLSTIRNSVGELGQNDSSDVKVVQSLLNALPGDFQGQAGQLKVDGLVGPKTCAAIRQFQKTILMRPDGLVAPLERGGITIGHLIVAYAALEAVRSSQPAPTEILAIGEAPAIGPVTGPTAPPPSHAIMQKASWKMTTSSIDVSAGYVAVSGGTADVTDLRIGKTYNLPFASVGGGLTWQPAAVMKLLGRIFSSKLPHVYELAWNTLTRKTDVLIKYLPADMLITYLIKAMGLSTTFFLPSWSIGDVYFFTNVVKRPDLNLADFGGGCVILALGAGIIAGGSGALVMFGGEAKSVLELFVPNGVALMAGISVGLNIGAGVSLCGGYISNYPV